MSGASTGKLAWRRRLRQRRRAVTKDDAAAAADAAKRRLAATGAWRSATHIGTYLARDGEFDAAPINALARSAGKSLYLPSVHDGGLRFLQWESTRELVINRYGIEEPAGDAREAQHLDLLLMPLVGWTGRGFRLGMGGGYYDRYLADRGRWPRLRIGLAFECQREDNLEALLEPWDQGLDAVLTERNLYLFERPPGDS